ncbi:alkaline phosphatase [Planococcus lenghuensis]|uniref:Alkaline phosphatase n=1 Tax=Planococcus lenghuensis TaxID=2213202 RepID=A0A1Q2KYI7_9BACL|nr:alkaline phosphatase [Planococcus lenghuensis]AQQ53196.1 alkaline phosphatase [Planococcus lenghuensis]
MINKRQGKKLLPAMVISSLLVGGFAAGYPGAAAKGENPAQNPETAVKEANQKQAKIKNVIFLIGDGMGPAYNTAYRAFKDNQATPYMEKTAFDTYLVGMQQTYSWDPEQSVTDSAAAATSLAAGIKTYNGAIAVDMEKNDVKTVLETAKEDGKATGLVATSQINHATPASFGSHDESRHNYNDIADDYFDDLVNGEHKVDVLLGGGTSYFDRADRNLTAEFAEDGYGVVTTRAELLKDESDQLLGLFAPKGLDKAIDRNEETPSLAEMTDEALERLSEDQDGFFLMVEGSQIDWAGHDNDIVGAMSEMEDFEKAFARAIEFAEQDEHTLVITTADHSTGGFALGRDGEYKWDPRPLQAAERTPDFMAAQIAAGSPVEEVLAEYINLDLTAEEVQSVKDAAASGKAVEIDNAIEHIFNIRSGTGWTTGGHTGVDVNVYAYGPQWEEFVGLHDNHILGQKVMEVFSNTRNGK